MIVLLLAAAVAPLGAAHDGQLVSDAIQWRSVYFATEAAAGRLDLALPLPEDAALSLPEGVEAVVRHGDKGGIVALETTESAWKPVPGGVRLEIGLRQELPDRGQPVRLLAPLCSGNALQRIVLRDGERAVRFVPDAALGIEQALFYASSRGVTRRERDALERRLSLEIPPPAAWTAWVLADAELTRRGLTGSLRDGRPARSVALAVGAGFLAIVAALLIAYRALARRALHDRDEATLSAELSRLRLRHEGDEA